MGGGLPAALTGGIGVVLLRRMLESAKVKTALARGLTRLHPDYHAALNKSTNAGKLSKKAKEGLDLAFNSVVGDITKIALTEYLAGKAATTKQEREKSKEELKYKLRARKAGSKESKALFGL